MSQVQVLTIRNQVLRARFKLAKRRYFIVNRKRMETDTQFQLWYNSLPLSKELINKKRQIREQIESKKINEFRIKMANLSELKVFFQKNHNKKAKILKDINGVVPLYQGEELIIDKEDYELINSISTKLGPDRDIKEIIMILNESKN